MVILQHALKNLFQVADLEEQIRVTILMLIMIRKGKYKKNTY